MIDPIALHGSQSVPHTGDGLQVDAPAADRSLEPAHTRSLRFVRAVSHILAPAPVSLPLVLLVAFYRASSVAQALLYAAITLFFLSIGPLLYVLLGVHLGKLTDMDISQRAQRAGPFVFALSSACLGELVLILTHAPTILTTVMLVIVINGLLVTLITLRWKISLHASSLAGAATTLTILYGAIMLPTFGLLILVNWSRVVLRRHTIAQVVVGSLLSIVLSALTLKLLGL